MVLCEKLRIFLLISVQMLGRQLFGIPDTENDAFNKDGEFAIRQTVNCLNNN